MRTLGLMALLLLAFFAVAAQNVRTGPEPGWLFQTQPNPDTRPAANTISNGYYLVLFDHQVNLAAATDYTHQVKQVVNETGVQNESEISVTFAPEYQQVIFHKILLIRNGKTINQLVPSRIKVVQEESDAEDFQYNGLKRAFLLLKDVQKGDRIETVYSVQGVNPVFAGKYSDKIYFLHTTAICNYFETIMAPASRKLVIRSFRGAAMPQKLQQNGLDVYHWKNPVLKTWQSADNAPSWYDDSPEIAVSEFSSWEEVVNWGLETFRHYKYPLPAVLQSKIVQWQAEARGDKDLFATTALRFVQDQVRYQGLEMGTYTHQPHAPEEVFQQRFGDCKDKALLLTMILQQQGIPAYIALVNTSVRSKLIEAAPSTSEFDHAIVAVERGKNFIYLDPTDVCQRGELVNIYIPAYGYALVIKPGEDKLEPVEPGILYATSVVAKLDVRLYDTSRLLVSTTYSGGAADAIRSSLTEYSSDELEENYVKYYAREYEDIKQAFPLTTSDDSVRNTIDMEESYVIPHIWRKGTKDKEFFESFVRPIYNQLPDPSASPADVPLSLRFPASIQYRIQINMPDDWTFDLEDLHLKTGSYQFDFTSKVKGKQVELRYYWKALSDFIAPADVRQYKEDQKQMMDVLGIEFNYQGRGLRQVDDSIFSPLQGSSNWLVVAYALLLTAALAWMLRHYDRYTVNRQVAKEDQLPLGGWVLVLGGSLLLSGITGIVGFAEGRFFSKSLWISLHQSGAQPLQFVHLVNFTFTLVRLAGLAALLYWYVGCRDIFPQMMLWWLGIMIAGDLSQLALTSFIHYPASFGNVQQVHLLTLLSHAIYAGVWGTYVVRSERVRFTFVNDR